MSGKVNFKILVKDCKPIWNFKQSQQTIILQTIILAYVQNMNILNTIP